MYQDRIQQLDKLPRDRRRRLDLFYREAAERHNGAWRGKGYSGEDYREPGHPYQFDLNILGEGSLFEYLATARTEAGRRALAAHLLHPVSADEARARQAAVRELSALPDLREAVATLGETTYSDCNADAANAWLTMAPANFPSWLAPLALLTSSALALLLIVALLALVPWKVAVPYLAGLLIWHGLLAYVHQSQVRPLLKAGFELEPEIAILHDGLSLLARQSFTAPKLQQLQRRAAALPADLRRLRRLTHWAREREKEYFYAPSMYLFIGTQLAIRLEGWRTTHGAHLQEAIAIWSEFEALEALGTYAFEHPGDVYPEF